MAALWVEMIYLPAVRRSDQRVGYEGPWENRDDSADAPISAVGNVKATIRTQCDSQRRTELRPRGRPAIAVVATVARPESVRSRLCRSSYSSENTVGADPADAAVPSVCNIDSTIGSNDNVRGLEEEGLQ